MVKRKITNPELVELAIEKGAKGHFSKLLEHMDYGRSPEQEENEELTEEEIDEMVDSIVLSCLIAEETEEDFLCSSAGD